MNKILGFLLLFFLPFSLSYADISKSNGFKDIETFGSLVIAVGDNGVIARSTDKGKTWVQSKSPLSVTYTAVDFISASKGWAVGHQGSIISTSDGGQTWTKQLDNLSTARLLKDSVELKIQNLEKMIKASSESDAEELEFQLEDERYKLEELQSNSINESFLDVVFLSDNRGFAVGARGLFLETSNGGKSWSVSNSKLDNIDGFNLNAIAQISESNIVIVGESGLSFISQNMGKSWESLELDADKSLFNVLPFADNSAYIFGAGGVVYKSSDSGASWKSLPIKNNGNLHFGAASTSSQVVFGSDAKGYLFNGNKSDRVAISDEGAISAIRFLDDDNLVLSGSKGLKVVSKAEVRPLKFELPFAIQNQDRAFADNFLYDPNLMVISFLSPSGECPSADLLLTMDLLSQELRKSGLASSVYSLADYAKTNSKILNEGIPKWQTLPMEQSLTNVIIDRAPIALSSADCSQSNIILSAKDTSKTTHKEVSQIADRFQAKEKLKVHAGFGLAAANSVLNLTNREAITGVILVNVGASTGNIFTREYLVGLKEMTDSIYDVFGVNPGRMKSLWWPSARYSVLTEDGWEGGSIMPENFDYSKNAKNELMRNIALSGQVGQMVAPNFKASKIYVPYQKDRQAVLRQISDLAVSYNQRPNFQIEIIE